MSTPDSADLKRCPACERDLPATTDHFSRRSASKDGFQAQCKPCRSAQFKEYRAKSDTHARACRKWRLRTFYGLDEERLEAMAEAQGHRCAGCKSRLKGLVVDHCHVHGHVRGLLCNSCNLTLGHAKDNVDTLRRLADYLL